MYVFIHAVGDNDLVYVATGDDKWIHPDGLLSTQPAARVARDVLSRRHDCSHADGDADAYPNGYGYANPTSPPGRLSSF